MRAGQDLAMQLGFALQLGQRQGGEGDDDDRGHGEPRGGQAARRGQRASYRARSAPNAARAAATVASMSAGECALETKPASYAEGAR